MDAKCSRIILSLPQIRAQLEAIIWSSCCEWSERVDCVCIGFFDIGSGDSCRLMMAMAMSALGSASLLLPSRPQRYATPGSRNVGLARLEVNAALRRTGEKGLGGGKLGLSCFGRGLPQSEAAFGGEVVMRPLDVRAQAGRGDSVNAAERVVAAVGYFLPFFDGIQYGRYFFLQFPVAERLIAPLFPLLSAYKGFPFSNFIAFFGLYLAVVRNPSFSRYVRFNTMQAVVLDVLLIFPTLVERTFTPRGGIGFELLVLFYNSVFLFLVACFLFGIVSCLLGKTPRLPLVAEAADQQV